MEHLPNSPDLALWNFFLFHAMKQAFTRQHFNTIDDLSMDVEAFLTRLSAEFLQTIFQE
jgi:hypothetical protein